LIKEQCTIFRKQKIESEHGQQSRIPVSLSARVLEIFL